MDAEVAIAGAGPGGLALALALDRRGVGSVVLEKGTLPQRKVCGEGLMPSGLARLEALGVRAHLDPDGCHPFVGIRYVSRSGRTAEGTFRGGPGLGIRRDALSRALVAAARERDRIEIREGTAVSALRRSPDGVEVDTSTGPVRARLLVGADGLHSRVRALAGLEGPLGRRRRYGTGQHFAVEPWTDRVVVHWGTGVEAYVTPVGPRCVGVAMLWDRDGGRPHKAGADVMRSLLGGFPELAARLAGAETVDEPRSTGPLAHATAGIVARRIALLGDASGYLDAITGEGLSLAFDEALALGELLPDLLRDDRLAATDLAPYVAAHRRITAPYLRFTGLVLALGCSPALVERLVAMLGRNPDLFSTFLDVNMGRAGLGALGVGGCARVVRDFLRPPPAGVASGVS